MHGLHRAGLWQFAQAHGSQGQDRGVADRLQPDPPHLSLGGTTSAEFTASGGVAPARPELRLVNGSLADALIEYKFCRAPREGHAGTVDIARDRRRYPYTIDYPQPVDAMDAQARIDHSLTFAAHPAGPRTMQAGAEQPVAASSIAASLSSASPGTVFSPI